MEFTTDYDKILSQIDEIEPKQYAKTRNFINGKVTRLSPYISRGVISTKQVFQSVLDRGFTLNSADKFIQELAWRDYWQQVWVHKGSEINQDLKRPQEDVENYEMPAAINNANTGIDAVDEGVKALYKTGYMHNHVRMYTAAIACNMGHSAWKTPAKWMYYRLLDGDWASNALSWQWVAGSNAGKKYVANQQNINKYCFTKQTGTFLDVEYSDFNNMKTPEVLKETVVPKLKTPLPESTCSLVNPELPTFIYNWYNLDPAWEKDVNANRILLLEPAGFEEFPISGKSVDFMLGLSKNIEEIQIFTGKFDELVSRYSLSNIHYKEHPLNKNYRGTEHSRDWMFDVSGYHPSFFAFWKKCKKEWKVRRVEQE